MWSLIDILQNLELGNIASCFIAIFWRFCRYIHQGELTEGTKATARTAITIWQIAFEKSYHIRPSNNANIVSNIIFVREFDSVSTLTVFIRTQFLWSRLLSFMEMTSFSYNIPW